MIAINGGLNLDLKKITPLTTTQSSKALVSLNDNGILRSKLQVLIAKSNQKTECLKLVWLFFCT